MTTATLIQMGKKRKKQDINNNETINVRQYLRKYLDSSTYQELDIRNFYDEIDYPITIKQPFPFFYQNSVFEKSLKSKLIFQNGGNFSFCLSNYDNTKKQEYRLYHIPYDRNKKDTLRLSINDLSFHICKNDTIEIELCGYIPSPYQCPDLSIKDSQKRVEYTIPVVFLRRLPISAKLVMICILITLFLIYIYFISNVYS